MLLSKRSIYLFDEPTTAIDDSTQKKLYTIINELKNDAIVIAVTHDISLIDKADRIINIENGKIAITQK